MAETLMGWLIPNRVIYALARAHSIEENRLAVNRAIQLMDESSAPAIHHIIDQSQFSPKMANADPADVSTDLRRMLQHPKVGWVLTCYGDNLFVKYVNWVLAHENQVKSRHFETANVAASFLVGVDDSLPPLPDVDAFIKDFRERHR